MPDRVAQLAIELRAIEHKQKENQPRKILTRSFEKNRKETNKNK